MALQLVEQPAHAAVFLPNVLPLVTRVSQEVSNPECREVATQAVKTLEHLKTELDAVTKANEDITTAVRCAAGPPGSPASCCCSSTSCQAFGTAGWLASCLTPAGHT